MKPNISLCGLNSDLLLPGVAFVASVSSAVRALASSISLLAGALMFLLGGTLASQAGLDIIPTFGSSIASDPNAAAIEAAINADIAVFESHIANNVTVSIDFQEGGGLGSSSTYIGSIGYNSYLSALQNHQVVSANDNTAIASVLNNPVSGSPNITLTTSLLRALGFNANPPAGQPDSTITLNTSIMNLSRTGPQNSSFYDLGAVAAHEIDEVLGIGGAGSQLGQSGTAIGPLDLFRYSAPGTRSYTTASGATAYFSINGGANRLVYFNQYGSGSDYGDWGDGAADGSGNNPPQIQDAFGTPGSQPNLGINEFTALDVVGWDLAVVPEFPEPATLAGCGLCGLSLIQFYRQRKRTIGIQLPSASRPESAEKS